MSFRARNARRLASLLSTLAGVDVSLRYDREFKRYHVVWNDGPDHVQMQTLAIARASTVPYLDLSELSWSRRSA